VKTSVLRVAAIAKDAAFTGREMRKERTAVYAQMAYSASRVARSSEPGRQSALALWWLQLGLNAAWSPNRGLPSPGLPRHHVEGRRGIRRICGEKVMAAFTRRRLLQYGAAGAAACLLPS
jgi:hypothetical protein